jgi:DNA repair protein RadC
MKSIKEWQADERPREKMATRGAEALSNAELLAILIRTGDSSKTAVDLSRDLIESANGSIKELSSMSPERMSLVKGIGLTKAITITAAVEFGKRIATEGKANLPTVFNSRVVAELMTPFMRDLPHEECWVLYLNRANKLIGREKLSVGGVSSTVMDVKIITKKAIEKLSSGIVLVHNHPSGNVLPGEEDRRQTVSLRKAIELFNIVLVDHIIIGKNDYYSFADENL